MLIFFLPETQYFRDTSTGTPNPSSSTDAKESTARDHEEITSEESIPDGSSIPRKRSYLQELIPWSGINPGIAKGTSFLFLFIRPWPLILYPAVMYSTLVFSFVLGCVLIVVNTAAATFQSPPYNMSPGIQSLIFLAGVIGSVIGAIVGGPFTDLFGRWQSKKNNGIFEPETRLVMLLFPLFVVPAGVLMYESKLNWLIDRYGFGIARLYVWVLPYVGVACVYVGLGGLPTTSISYGTAHLPLTLTEQSSIVITLLPLRPFFSSSV